MDWWLNLPAGGQAKSGQEDTVFLILHTLYTATIKTWNRYKSSPELFTVYAAAWYWSCVLWCVLISCQRVYISWCWAGPWCQVRVLSLECEEYHWQESLASWGLTLCLVPTGTLLTLVFPWCPHSLLLSIATAAWTQLCQSCHSVCCLTCLIMGSYFFWISWKDR